MKLTKPQLLVLSRAAKGLALDGDLYTEAKGSQSATAGRYRVISELRRRGFIDAQERITETGLEALSI